MKISDTNTNILITGAGLCGALLGLRLAQRGYNVNVLEKRPDMRTKIVDAGRSINLALSDRGLSALKMVGLGDKVKELCIPMKARMIHPKDGKVLTSNYSGRDDDYINSISREDLNKLLLDKADEYKKVQIDFKREITSVDLRQGSVDYKNLEDNQIKHWNPDILLGTDGAGSRVRAAMARQRDFFFSYTTNWLPHAYKELRMPPADDGGWRIDKHALHIWPRGGFMLIALPNLDGSFTMTLFMRRKDSPHSFEEITTDDQVTEFFKEEFPDVYDQIPDLLEQYQRNPVPPLGTVRCSPWAAHGKVLMMGDACHAIVPFYGQGMNAGFEDVLVFDQILEECEDWDDAMNRFSIERKPDTDAIADLALDNFVEMRDSVSHPNFQTKRAIEMKLESAFAKEQYSSKYSLVTFPPEGMGYREAMIKGRAQDKAIIWLIDNNLISVDDNAESLLAAINKKTEEVIWHRN
ncbi:kynurenine 3-monooxygenase [Nonlabens sp. Hel1_33_55]|uniref:FAD-dependent oxidoreductase n=1 Tax=Nonlabens sp. Hel1_33_55 TaxID=1336802 RepID=UPI000875D2D9|nr:NAD(P)/FAD-dependent oxidoreductase [Nonlabens sp. Hel1_33_55]SCY25574.1 kynurenine 3-monooxygenase [Nonlabens sp. Hel1_33_55]